MISVNLGRSDFTTSYLTMTHFLRQISISRAPKIPITPQEFLQAKDARSVLSSAFALEEAYDLLVSNYIELEQEALQAAATEVCREVQAYDDFFDLRSTLNRRFVNLLSACRAYLDQAPQLLTDCADDSQAARAELKKSLSENYDASFSYRFFEALRNHVQHCGLAVHRVSVNNRWNESASSRELEVSVEPYAMRKYLDQDAKFKKVVLDETPEEIPLLGHLRAYMQALGEAHGVVRAAFQNRTQAARACFEEHIQKYAGMNGGVTVGLAAITADESGLAFLETTPIMLDWDDVRIKLSKRNSTLGRLASRVVVSRGK